MSDQRMYTKYQQTLILQDDSAYNNETAIYTDIFRIYNVSPLVQVAAVCRASTLEGLMKLSTLFKKGQ
jgi:hypothetical protein